MKLKELTVEEQAILNGKSEIDKTIYMDKTSSSSIIDSRKLLSSGKLIEIRTHTRYVHFPKHTHNYVEVVYMCEGHTEHIINGDRVVLNEGELLFLNQNATQEILPAGGNDIAVNFIILPEFFDQSLVMIGEEENLVRDFLLGCLRGDDHKVAYLHFKVSEVLPVQNLIENLIWTLTNKQQNRRSINQITMGLLLLQLMNHGDKVTSGRNHYEQQLLLSVYSYIDEHYREGELSKLAAELHLDLYWLSRAIRRLSGKTYTELLQTRRLNRAAFLLGNTTMAVADVGNAIGYDNLSYFHRIFKARFGMSPKEYRDRS